MMRYAILAVLFCGLICGVTWGATQTLTLKDGTRLIGDVTKTADGYEVKLPFGPTVRFGADKVQSAVACPDPRGPYKDRLAKIADPADAAAHVDIARWANENAYWDIAQTEAKKALEIQSDNQAADLMLRKAQGNLDQAMKDGTKTEPAATTKESTGDASGGRDLVSDDDVLKIRLFELKKDESASIEFRNKVLDRFIDMMKGRQEFKYPEAITRFKGLPRIAQIQYIRDKIDADQTDILDDMLVKSDPKFMKDFHSFVWPMLTQSCAQLQCHAAPTGQGGLKLYNTAEKNADYTNFLILSLWEKGGKRLIDRGDNDMSLLLQFGLPPSVAKFHHPKPLAATLYPGPKASMYKKMAAWIASLEGSTAPNYRTEYQPPVGRKLTSGAAAALSGAETKPSGASSKPAGEDKDPFK